MRVAVVVSALLLLILALITVYALQPVPDNLSAEIRASGKNSYLDRHGKRLNITYQNHWNVYDQVKLHEAPEFLQLAFIVSEDKRFMQHNGIDWLARLNALKQNLLAGHIVRGASTITEQVVRMLHSRPRTVWSRWLEGLEAMRLETKAGKLDILEFYLNQVPYKARRRGIVQAAEYYFDRDLNTLNEKEMLALTVLVRSPKWLDPKQRDQNLKRAIDNLLPRLPIAPDYRSAIERQTIQLHQSRQAHDLSHFIRFAETQTGALSADGRIHTTIDLELQLKAQKILDSRLNQLKQKQVQNGAVLVVDHHRNEILAWVVGHAGKSDQAFNQIDPIIKPRQPGSALKPLLYAKALSQGWTAATLLDDSPLEESVGYGLHAYHNYSRDHYGLISVREALGNSLNIPAVRAIQYVGADEFLRFLKDFGVNSLSAHPNVYGDGLALGNGELTLFELLQAYTVLARMGDFKALSFLSGDSLRNGSQRILSAEIASLVADILSDPQAREKEFGWHSVLNLPYQTAVKTGTSSDYRDAWAMGFNDRYTVGVWMGNLNYSEMDQVTGSSGPALVLRSIFNELNKNREVKALYLSEQLIKQAVCIDTGLPATDACPSRDEWFIATAPDRHLTAPAKPIRMRKPGNGLMLAMDPRIPDESEYFEFEITEVERLKAVKWFINNQQIAGTDTANYHWKVSKGHFTAQAQIIFNDSRPPVNTDIVSFQVN